ncbi:glycosyltransferase [Dorea sp. 5-2]|jgi:glycosyltransferase family protein|uniref:GT-D fold domain-containing glycosyltransferase n=1 Tax=Sporofaciens sp. JLR.KK001 TaxID=3112621 RepID=UPI000336150D|nr:glycosyltransferase [Dorea sp. 5-2]
MLCVYVWGAGYYAQQVIDEIDKENVNILGIFDQDEQKCGTDLFYPIPIILPIEISRKKFDYLIISVKKYQSILNECKRLNIPSEKIIIYWERNEKNNIFVERSKRVEELMCENRKYQYRLDSAPYEWGIKFTPKILNGQKLLKKIILDNSSLCRFGDGEFEIIRQRERPWFQKPNSILGNRLKEILVSKTDRINIAIAQNFGNFEQYKEEAADIIREYMFGDTRRYILELIDKNRIYYDTYVTRPYIIYKNKKNADEIFLLFKKIWEKKSVVIVEGEYSRIGIGNDLMEGTSNIFRILCPYKNAWDKYEDILGIVLKKVSKNSLVCISLGPTATVLAYDLAQRGYQALDIGQLDNEYEWYLRDVRERISIPGKLVAEVSEKQSFVMVDERKYLNQVIAKVV